MRLYKNVIKNIFDVISALISLLLLAPLMLLISIYVYIFISSNIIFYQSRPGLKGKIFTLYKFRTMNEQFDSSGKLLEDSKRLTKAGNILRSLSLDELPELLNILKGEMSFIGPRPLLPEYLELYNCEEMKRHNAKPGLTGLAQVNGRNMLNWDEKFSLDIFYTENISFILDAKIFFKTVWLLFNPRNINHNGKLMPKFTGSKNK